MTSCCGVEGHAGICKGRPAGIRPMTGKLVPYERPK